MVFSPTPREGIIDLAGLFYDDIESYQCLPGESKYHFKCSNNWFLGDGAPGMGFIGVWSGACCTNGSTESFGIRMQHTGGDVINLSAFTTYRATSWAPGDDPYGGGGYGCTDIWIKPKGLTQYHHIDLSTWAYGTPYTVNPDELPLGNPNLNFTY